MLTFEPHPRTVVAPQAAPKLLTTLEQKTDLIAALGVDDSDRAVVLAMAVDPQIGGKASAKLLYAESIAARARGIDPARMRTISYGKERPVAVCNDISCWSQNRRAVTVLNAGGA